MSIGYNFKSSFKECCQLSQNILRDIFHPSFIKRLEKKKGYKLFKNVWMGQSQNMSNELNVG
jgi:hypothetical protein